jgi:hypothetical protein
MVGEFVDIGGSLAVVTIATEIIGPAGVYADEKDMVNIFR